MAEELCQKANLVNLRRGSSSVRGDCCSGSSSGQLNDALGWGRGRAQIVVVTAEARVVLSETHALSRVRGLRSLRSVTRAPQLRQMYGYTSEHSTVGRPINKVESQPTAQLKGHAR